MIKTICTTSFELIKEIRQKYAIVTAVDYRFSWKPFGYRYYITFDLESYVDPDEKTQDGKPLFGYCLKA